MFGQWNIEQTPGYLWLEWMSRVASPYETNPLDLNPLRDALKAEIDFEKVRNCKGLQIYIGATNVHTGRITVFDQKELTAAHVLASACLPSMFKAVEIDGIPYWDGGYTGNPALFPLFQANESADLIIVQLNRVIRNETPMTARAIENRLNEITFNASLLGELRAIEFVQRLVDEGRISADHYRRLRMHRIDADKPLRDLSASSKANAEPDFVEMLFKRGQAVAKQWIVDHFDDLGVRDTLDLSMLLSGKVSDEA